MQTPEIQKNYKEEDLQNTNIGLVLPISIKNQTCFRKLADVHKTIYTMALTTIKKKNNCGNDAHVFYY